VETLLRQIPDRAWHRCRIVEGSKGPLVADFAALRARTTRAWHTTSWFGCGSF
jgi:hypothetical protein